MAAEDLVTAFCTQVDQAAESWRLEHANWFRLDQSTANQGFGMEYVGGQPAPEGLVMPEATTALRGIRYRIEDRHISITALPLALGALRDTLAQGIMFYEPHSSQLDLAERLERTLASNEKLEMALHIAAHPHHSFQERQALAKLTEQEQAVYEAWRIKSEAARTEQYAGQRNRMLGRGRRDHSLPDGFRTLGRGEPRKT